MAGIKGVKAGVKSVFVAVSVDANSNPDMLPVGIIPVWSSSDTTNAPVVVDPSDPSGLTVNITPPASAPSTGTFTLMITATLPNGPITTSVTVPFLPLAVAGFTITQTV